MILSPLPVPGCWSRTDPVISWQPIPWALRILLTHSTSSQQHRLPKSLGCIATDIGGSHRGVIQTPYLLDPDSHGKKSELHVWYIKECRKRFCRVRQRRNVQIIAILPSLVNWVGIARMRPPNHGSSLGSTTAGRHLGLRTGRCRGTLPRR